MIQDYGSYTDINSSNNKKESTTNSYRWLYALLSIIVLCGVGYYIYPQSANFTSNHLFVEELDDKALSDMRIEAEKQRPTVWIEYDRDEFVSYSPGATSQDLVFGGSIWRTFHDEQIRKAGYNPSDKSYSFAFRVNDGVQSSFTPDYVPPQDPVIIYIDHDDVLYLNSVKDDFDANMDYQRTLVEAAGYDFDDYSLLYEFRAVSDGSDSAFKANCGRPVRRKPKKTKAPKPTKAPKTPKPAKTPRPAKAPKTRKPKPTKAPTPLSSNLDCYTVFKETAYTIQSIYGGYMNQIDCGYPIVKGVALTSCLSYRPGEGGAAYGEDARQDYYQKNYFYCQTWSKFSDVNNPDTVPVAISGRCCSSTNKKAVVHSDSIQYLSSRTILVCGTSGDCSDKDQNIIHSGCAAGWSYPNYGGVGFSKKPMGGKYDGNGGCLVGSSDKNTNTASNLCIRAGGPEGNVAWDCQDIESSSAIYNSIDGNYESIADCPIGYSILDCNSFIDIIEQCKENDNEHSHSLGGYYGANGEQCVAVGNMNNIRAQARCCRIAV